MRCACQVGNSVVELSSFCGHRNPTMPKSARCDGTAPSHVQRAPRPYRSYSARAALTLPPCIAALLRHHRCSPSGHRPFNDVAVARMVGVSWVGNSQTHIALDAPRAPHRHASSYPTIGFEQCVWLAYVVIENFARRRDQWRGQTTSYPSSNALTPRNKMCASLTSRVRRALSAARCSALAPQSANRSDPFGLPIIHGFTDVLAADQESHILPT